MIRPLIVQKKDKCKYAMGDEEHRGEAGTTIRIENT